MADNQGPAGGAPPETITGEGANTVPNVTWDDSNMRTSFANVVNGASTREEVTLFFGTNQTWNVQNLKELKVQLSDRIILTPYAAKRLWLLLGNIINQYEQRFGELNLDALRGSQRGRRN